MSHKEIVENSTLTNFILPGNSNIPNHLLVCFVISQVMLYCLIEASLVKNMLEYLWLKYKCHHSVED